MKNLDYHAKLLIHGLPGMTVSERCRLVEWLRAAATEIKNCKDLKIFSANYRARLMK